MHLSGHSRTAGFATAWPPASPALPEKRTSFAQLSVSGGHRKPPGRKMPRTFAVVFFNHA